MSRPILGDKTMRTLWSRFTKKWHVKECKKGHKAIANPSFCYRTVNSKVAIRLHDNQQTNAAPTGSEPCHWPPDYILYWNIISSVLLPYIRMQWSSYRLLTIVYLYHISYDRHMIWSDGRFVASNADLLTWSAAFCVSLGDVSAVASRTGMHSHWYTHDAGNSCPAALRYVAIVKDVLDTFWWYRSVVAFLQEWNVRCTFKQITRIGQDEFFFATFRKISFARNKCWTIIMT